MNFQYERIHTRGNKENIRDVMNNYMTSVEFRNSTFNNLIGYNIQKYIDD